MTTTLYSVFGSLVGLYIMAIVSYRLVLHWVGWETTTQSCGYATTLALAWKRCHAKMYQQDTHTGDGLWGWWP